MRMANEGLAFLLELLALAALAYWGLAEVAWAGIGAPALAAVLWGLFAAPRATFTLPVVGVLLVKVLVFGSAVAALIAVGALVPGIVFGVLVVVNTAILQYYRGKKVRSFGTFDHRDDGSAE
ncbi:YrdB family protein [Amycolatopsis sp. K13G38]|uniref:YrdB family protein n=1 Tax=Amycolatopsis acididurans TaxID=2724524 RepID=A0ABX1JDN9_9PSEU|nr:YrdB family protein [Amycolatopsis acididurans]NKQ57356.1 YrdB family protein [Amycolatopsis acididurans]